MNTPRTTRAVYESLDVLANQRTAPTPISDDEYYPAVTELMCWLTEFELAERIAYAHPLNPEGAYWRMLARHIGNVAVVDDFTGRIVWKRATVYAEVS